MVSREDIAGIVAFKYGMIIFTSFVICPGGHRHTVRIWLGYRVVLCRQRCCDDRRILRRHMACYSISACVHIVDTLYIEECGAWMWEEVRSE